MAALQQLLAHFQGTADFRAGFDPHVMATAIRAAINAVPAQLARDPALDIGRHARELADRFHTATRPGKAHRDRIVAYASFEPGPEDRPADSI